VPVHECVRERLSERAGERERERGERERESVNMCEWVGVRRECD